MFTHTFNGISDDSLIQRPSSSPHFYLASQQYTSTLALFPGSLFRILSRRFGEKSARQNPEQRAWERGYIHSVVSMYCCEHKQKIERPGNGLS